MRWLIVVVLCCACWACVAPTATEEGLPGADPRSNGPPTTGPTGVAQPGAAPAEKAVGVPPDEGAAAPAPDGVEPDGPVALAARRFVAVQRGVELSEVRLVSLEAVTWPDSSLGCPEPDQMYLQVLTPGYRVALEVGSERFVVHADRSDPPRISRCARPGPPVADTTS